MLVQVNSVLRRACAVGAVILNMQRYRRDRKETAPSEVRRFIERKLECCISWRLMTHGIAPTLYEPDGTQDGTFQLRCFTVLPTS